jgi:ABC-type branched-subunit amino acid transport system substrate-binding protein
VDHILDTQSSNCKVKKMVNATIVPVLTLAFVFDGRFYWAESIVRHTIQMLNNRTDSWHDDIFPAGDVGTVIRGVFEAAECDDTDAARAYWKIRSELGNVAPMGVCGARCTQATMALVAASSGENVPVVSPASNSPVFSDKEQFPLVSTLVAPADARGEAGALAALCEKFGWDRVSIILTDSKYSQNLATAFKGLWQESGGRQIAYSNEIRLNTTGDADVVIEESVLQVLEEVPTDNPVINSRVILLIAHDQHAYDILRIAHREGFQKDTIWVGSGAWVGNDRIPTDQTFDVTNYRQGYIGIIPSQNRNQDYQHYLRVLNTYRVQAGETPYTDLPDYAAETLADSILTLVLTILKLPVESWRDGALVTSMIRNLTFDGVNGPVSFTAEGGRAYPSFTVVNTQSDENGTLKWMDVGSISMNGTRTQFVEVRMNETCFSPGQCGQASAPDDSYPYLPIPLWVIVVIPLVVLLLLVVLAKYVVSRRSKNRYKERLLNLDEIIEKAKKEKGNLMIKGIEVPSNWTTAQDDDQILVDVSPLEDDYWDVQLPLSKDMPDAHISRLYRVQNRSLYAYYCFHKDRFSMHGIAHNEVDVWHGTSYTDPEVICNDRETGFLMQLARMGFWGRGIYFAVRSSYSHSYAFKPHGEGWHSASPNRPTGRSDEREMILAKLLVGRATTLEQDSTLVIPPLDPRNLPHRYHTVQGHTGGSPVYIVYENGRGYPAFLVRYYRGTRDSTRTPFASRDQAMAIKAAAEAAAAKVTHSDAFQHSPGTSVVTVSDDLEMGVSDGRIGVSPATWEFLDNTGWTPYCDEHQAILEAGRNRGNNEVFLETDSWKYKVLLKEMVQVNQEHESHRRRQVRRIPLDSISL